MNFDFLAECKVADIRMQEMYAAIYQDLRCAEASYWSDPGESGIFLRSAAEKICRVYNRYYEIGFPDDTKLEGFLCYTGEDGRNQMVSRFLSVVKKEQRERLNKLRVLGDDCVLGEEEPDSGMSLSDRMSQNAKRMMETMLEVLKEMCGKINGREELSGLRFQEEILPGKPKEPEQEEQNTFLSKLFRRNKKK